MGMIKHGDGQVIETTDVPEFTYYCTSCSDPIKHKVGDAIPTLCSKCRREKNQEK